MGKKIFKTIASDVDAGTHDDRIYDKALHPLRAKMRKSLLPYVRQETPVLAKMQKLIRTPWLDAYFLWTANLGTHTFFMIFLPLLIWFGNAALGRSVAVLTAFGVFWSGFLKDFMCLPRPLSPPVHRLTMSESTALEYGFPSTHSTNSISVALYFIAIACDSLSPESPMRLAAIIGCMIYAFSVVFGRLYCGMHSLTDVVSGSILAYILYWFQWTFRNEFNALFTDDTYWGNVSDKPGLFPGGWLCEHSDTCRLALDATAAAIESSSVIATFIIFLKVILGVAVLFVWRLACKKVCYFILPPIYRAFNLPHRKFEIGARTYKSLNKEIIHPIPSVLDLHGLTSSVRAAEHVGIQSAIDLHERTVALQHRAGKDNLDTVDEKAQADPLSLLIVEEAPLRYDVDIVTKLIVYAGIGFLTVFPVPLMFQFLFGAGRSI
ncbi:hypothetical protein DFQ28_006934 [Apophysomyces sp. BC1034]|nr:hypothetical protein DFQ29_005718 [Apophysomyces sp. BC1021]KAG0187048.1 hypothetical protein DFQ28_006934 [Apophysomyces sp. BC1034]